MVLSYDHIQSLGTLEDGIALNSYQLRLLGIGWPPKRGWVSGLIGREIPDDLFRLLMELRGAKKKRERIDILSAHGISACKLFHARL